MKKSTTFYHNQFLCKPFLILILLTCININLSAQSAWHYAGNNVSNSDSAVIGTTNGQGLQIMTNDTVRMYIDSLGNISQGLMNQTAGSYFTYYSLFYPAFTMGSFDTISNGALSTAIGFGNNVSNWASTAIGNYNVNSGLLTYSFGQQNITSNIGAISVGALNQTTGQSAMCFGRSNVASATDAYSIGILNQSTLDGAMSFGAENISSGYNSYGIGNICTASAQNAMAIGTLCQATDHNAVAIGFESASNNEQAIALGQNATAYGLNSTAIGNTATTYGTSSVAIGIDATAYGDSTIKLRGDSIISQGVFVAISGSPGAASPPPYTLGVIGNARIQGQLTVDSLAGTSNQVVFADPNGVLHVSTPNPPPGGWPVGVPGGPCVDGIDTWYKGVAAGDIVRSAGNVGIGMCDPAYPLDVCGIIRAKELKINLDAGCDFVFDSCYATLTLNQLSNYVKQNKHLPDIAPAKEMEANGINVGEMQAKLLQKIEELTLYIIEQDKKMDVQNERIEQLEKQIKN